MSNGSARTADPASENFSAREFFAVAREANIRTVSTPYRLENANEALTDLRAGQVHGAAVLTMA